MPGFNNLSSLQTAKRTSYSKSNKSNRNAVYFTDQQVMFCLEVFYSVDDEGDYNVDNTWVIQGVDKQGSRIDINTIAQYVMDNENSAKGIVKHFGLIGFDMGRAKGWKAEQEDKSTYGITMANLAWFEDLRTFIIGFEGFKECGLKLKVSDNFFLLDIDKSDYLGTKIRFYDPLAIEKKKEDKESKGEVQEAPAKKKKKFGQR